MNQKTYQYLLVAEQSVIPILPIVLQGLQRNGNPKTVTVVVPARQLKAFAHVVGSNAVLVNEEEVLPNWDLDRVRSILPAFPHRAGWYLQQFLKLQFGHFANTPEYVIWDADTVLLRPLSLADDKNFVVNRSREYHQPYFETFQRLFGYPAPLRCSVISQYMRVETGIITEMQAEIEKRHGKHWVEAILSVLAGKSESEFSEYETYANYLANRDPKKLVVGHSKWFRHGTGIVGEGSLLTLQKLEKVFQDYSYVSFERHTRSIWRRIGSHAQWTFRIGN